jgi:hypothetical protein
LPRVEAVHALAVDRVDVRDLLLEGRRVQERHEDHGARDVGGIEVLDELLDGDDRGVLGAVRAGDESEDGPGRAPFTTATVISSAASEPAGTAITPVRLRAARAEAVPTANVCPGRPPRRRAPRAGERQRRSNLMIASLLQRRRPVHDEVEQPDELLTTGTPMRKRSPSAVTSHATFRPSGS